MTATADRLDPSGEIAAPRRGKWKGPALTLGPGMIILLLFFVVPVSLVTVYSVLSRDTYGGVVWSFSLQAYEKLIGVPNPDELRDRWDFIYLNVILKSVLLAAVTAVLALLVGYPAAFFIARCGQRQKYFLLFLVTVPFFANALIRMYSWILILRGDGILNHALMYFGMISHPLQIIYTPLAVTVTMLYQYLPFMVLPLFASIEKLDTTLVEASLTSEPSARRRSGASSCR